MIKKTNGFNEERREYLKKILWTRGNGYFKGKIKNEKNIYKNIKNKKGIVRKLKKLN